MAVLITIIVIVLLIAFIYDINKKRDQKKITTEINNAVERAKYHGQAKNASLPTATQRYQEQQRKIEIQQRAKIMEFHINVFPVIVNNEVIMTEWKKNNCDHSDIEQVRRQWRALYQVIPICRHPEINIAYFLSSNRTSVYKTTLNSCDCEDFFHTHKPCKHMYRLFYEITKNNEDTRLFKLSEKTWSIFVDLEADGKVKFIETADSLANFGMHQIKLDKSLYKLVSLELFIVTGDPDYVDLLNRKTKDQIILAIAKRGIKGWKPSWSKVKLVDWVANNCYDYLSHEFSDWATLDLHPSISDWGRSITQAKQDYMKTFIKGFHLFNE